MLDTQLKSQIKRLWDRFWSSGLTNPLTAIEQMSFLIFMKKLEDEDSKRVREANFANQKYTSVFKNHEDCKWSNWSNLPAEEVLGRVRDKVFPFMRNLGGDDSIYTQYMKGANFAIPTPSLLVEAVNIINEMHIKEQNRDTQGDIYEFLLSELQSSGKNGQFRTPRHIIKMMVDLSEPKYGERIIDPACGTGGFLVNAYEYILEANKKDKISRLTPPQKKILDEESLYGIDIEETMVRISLMNLLMHGIRKPNIEKLNSLSRIYEEENKYDLVLANPPFKGSLNEAEISEKFRIKTKKTELLFLELMIRVLGPNGRCAVIVPEGVLFGNSNAHKEVRKMILEKCKLDAVISMPSGIFKPYAGVQTAVLYFKKGESTDKVWFYKLESDGFSLDDKRTITEQNDIPEIISKFKNRLKENPTDRKNKYFVVPIKEIKENNYDLSISKYRVIEYEVQKHEDSKIIKKKLLEIENDIIKILEESKFDYRD